ncbi:hypothetical protein [Streptosporangium sp. NPDC006007]|uniref:hypothetical protein n=1 Tax=Streptosporangium sp. NPDC006007 TaxID=3154575 RepID=UPI0033AD0DEB
MSRFLIRAMSSSMPQTVTLNSSESLEHLSIAHARRDHGYDHQRVLDLFNPGSK